MGADKACADKADMLDSPGRLISSCSTAPFSLVAESPPDIPVQQDTA